MFDYRRFSARLNLGCGFDHKPGYLNVDFQEFHHPDLVADVAALSMLPSGHYDEIVAQDVLEHLARTQTLGALREWNRLLRMGGVLRLRTPNILGLADLLQRPDYQTMERHEELVQALFGTQRYRGDFHLTSFTELLLRGYLERSGFTVAALASRDEWLFDVTAEKTAEAEMDLLGITDDTEFLTACYRRILRREPDADGQAFFLAALRSGEMRRAAVVEILSQSDEAKMLPRNG